MLYIPVVSQAVGSLYKIYLNVFDYFCFTFVFSNVICFMFSPTMLRIDMLNHSKIKIERRSFSLECHHDSIEVQHSLRVLKVVKGILDHVRPKTSKRL